MRDLNQLASKQETTPGTAIALAAADVLVRLREGDAPDINVDPVATQEIQAFSSSRPMRPSRRIFRANASWVLRPSATPLTVPPTCGPLLVAGLLKQDQIYELAVGAVTNPPFRDGDEIQGGTSGAKGIVFRDASATPLKYYAISGAFISGENVFKIGGGPSATSSANPVAKGFLYHLVDSDFVGGSDSKHHLTTRLFRGAKGNAFGWEGRGVLGEIAMEFKNNEHAVVRSSMLGAFSNWGSFDPFDLAAYPDDGITEPRFIASSLVLGSYSPTDLVEFGLTLPLNLELREDAQHAEGIRFADYDRRANPPVVTFEPAMVQLGTYDFFSQLANGTTFAMSWKLGTGFDFYADECQIISAGVGSRRSLATVPLQVRLCGKKNNEFYLYAH